MSKFFLFELSAAQMSSFYFFLAYFFMPEGNNRPEDIRADTRPSVAGGLFLFGLPSVSFSFFKSKTFRKKKAKLL
jgi:hypothetical protein